MRAEMRTRCPLCMRMIEIDDKIRHDEEEGGWVHVHCPPEPKVEICTECWLQKPCECDA